MKLLCTSFDDVVIDNLRDLISHKCTLHEAYWKIKSKHEQQMINRKDLEEK